MDLNNLAGQGLVWIDKHYVWQVDLFRRARGDPDSVWTANIPLNLSLVAHDRPINNTRSKNIGY